MVEIQDLDHLVLTVRDIDATCRFYVGVLGFREITFDGGRKALGFGSRKINLHEQGGEIEPHARRLTPGSADLCFLTNTPIDLVVELLSECGVPILEGPVERVRASGPIVSVYLHDPDGNLIEIANGVGTG